MNSGCERSELHELSGTPNRVDSSFLRLLEEHKQSQEALENEQFNVRLLVTCLRGVRHELRQTDAVRFDGLVRIIDKVLADCGWELNK